jgi:hypothetical protein
VPFGSQVRIGNDRDSDGYFDRDEIDVCSDPADPDQTPINLCMGDIVPSAGNRVVDVDDLLAIINNWGARGGPADIAPNCGDGAVDVDDLLAVINSWGPCP